MSRRQVSPFPEFCVEDQQSNKLASPNPPETSTSVPRQLYPYLIDSIRRKRRIQGRYQIIGSDASDKFNKWKKVDETYTDAFLAYSTIEILASFATIGMLHMQIWAPIIWANKPQKVITDWHLMLRKTMWLRTILPTTQAHHQPRIQRATVKLNQAYLRK